MKETGYIFERDPPVRKRQQKVEKVAVCRNGSYGCGYKSPWTSL